MRNSLICAATLMLGVAGLSSGSLAGKSSTISRTSSVEAITPTAQRTSKINIPAGTRILIRMSDSIDSNKQKTGYRFTARLETNLQFGNVVVAPRGTTLYGRLISADSAGRMAGSSQLTLELTDIVINGTAYPLLTSTYEMKGQGEGKKTTRKVLGGAGLGALIGGVAGGGKGAGIGAAAGAAGGTAVAASKKGQQLSISSETLLEFRLQQPASLPVAS